MERILVLDSGMDRMAGKSGISRTEEPIAAPGTTTWPSRAMCIVQRSLLSFSPFATMQYAWSCLTSERSKVGYIERIRSLLYTTTTSVHI